MYRTVAIPVPKESKMSELKLIIGGKDFSFKHLLDQCIMHRQEIDLEWPTYKKRVLATNLTVLGHIRSTTLGKWSGS